MDTEHPSENDVSKHRAEAAKLFDSARQAFDADMFDTAREIARRVWQLVKPPASLVVEARSRPKYSIIIATGQHSDDVIVALDRFVPYADNPDYEVIIVDTGNPFIETLCSVRYPRFRFHTVGFNYGSSGGRNAGAAMARGDYLLFFDDDGLIGDGCVEALVQTIRDNNACAVGGRIVTTAMAGNKGVSDAGAMDVKPSVINAEGVSIWRKDVFDRSAGFDVLLTSQAALLLCLGLYRYVGPTACLSAPRAVLVKDSLPSSGKEAEARNGRYVTHVAGPSDDILRALRNVMDNSRQIHAFAVRARYHALSSLDDSRAKTRVSFITTARNAKRFVKEFSNSLRWQTHGNFELVFVDDGSDDGTAQAMQACWQDDQRLRLISSEAIGRGAALNKALAAAENEICLIADVDDLSAPFRCAATIAALNEYRLDCLSFDLFNEKNAFLATQSYLPLASDFKVRQFFGTPASFPALAFRRSKFPLPFDTELTAGIDCDWLFRNSEANGGIHGRVIQLPAVYCRTHDGQISSTKRDVQRDVAIRCIMSYHELWLGKLGDDDRKIASMLSGWEPVTQDFVPRIKAYIYRLIRATATQKDFGDGLIDAMMGRLGEIELDVARRKAAKAIAQFQSQVQNQVPAQSAPVQPAAKAVVPPATVAPPAPVKTADVKTADVKPSPAVVAPAKPAQNATPPVAAEKPVAKPQPVPAVAAPLKPEVGATTTEAETSIMPSAPAVNRGLTLGKKPVAGPAPETQAHEIKAPEIKALETKAPALKPKPPVTSEAKVPAVKATDAKATLGKPAEAVAKAPAPQAADTKPGESSKNSAVATAAVSPPPAAKPVIPAIPTAKPVTVVARPVAPITAKPVPTPIAKPVSAPMAWTPSAPVKPKVIDDLANPARGFNYNYITGLNKFDGGIYDEAMRFFLAAQEAKPGSMFARWARAETLIGQGRNAEALPILKAIAQENPNNKKLGRRFDEVAAQGAQAKACRPPEAVTAQVIAARDKNRPAA